jgi:hypothetical protein
MSFRQPTPQAFSHGVIQGEGVVVHVTGQVVSLTIYFLDRADVPAIQRVRSRYFTAGTAPTSTLIQVPGLVVPELPVEPVPVAVVPHSRFKRPAS